MDFASFTAITALIRWENCQHALICLANRADLAAESAAKRSAAARALRVASVIMSGLMEFNPVNLYANPGSGLRLSTMPFCNGCIDL